MWGCEGDSAVQPHSMGGVGGERRDTHTHTGTRTGTYTLMLHLSEEVVGVPVEGHRGLEQIRVN